MGACAVGVYQALLPRREGPGDEAKYVRGGMKSLIFHVTCVHTNACHHGCVPHRVTVLKLKYHGIPSLNSVVLVADHSHICFVWGS